MGRGGGVMIHFRPDLVVLKPLPGDLDESILEELKYGNVRVQVAVVYNPPNGNEQDLLDKRDVF